MDFLVNFDFYRDIAKYIQTLRCFPLVLETRNTGELTIFDATLVFEIEDLNCDYEFLVSYQRPDLPNNRKPLLPDMSFGDDFGPTDISINRENHIWNIRCNFGKVLPHDRVRLDDVLYVGARSSGVLNLLGKVLAENIRAPIQTCVQINFQIGGEEKSVEAIVEMTKQKKSEQLVVSVWIGLG